MSPRQPHPLRELTETLRYELELQGIPSFVSTDGFPPPRSDLVYVLVDPRMFVALEGVRALPDDAVLGRTVLLGAERPDAMGPGEELELLKLGGAVFDLDARTVAAMRRHGVAARTLKPGYSRMRDHYDPDHQRPIDVMFLGTHSLRRTDDVRRCAPVLAGRNCLFHLSPDGPAGPEEFLGDGRWSLLAQSKVVLNLHADDRTGLEWLRVLDAIHAGAVVVSEHSSGIDTLEPGRHLLVASRESLPYVTDLLLRDERRLEQIRADAYERMRSWVPFALSASIFRAALIEILGRPLHAGVSLSGHEDLAAGDAETGIVKTRDVTLEQRLGETQAELTEVHEDLIRMRRQVVSLRSKLVPGTGAKQLVRTPAWDARRAPRVTVLVSLLDDDSEVSPTLDSVADSRLSDLELVVVGAGLTDEATAAVQWLRERPRVPGLVIQASNAQGRGPARNVGLQFARGEFVLILDPGSSVYALGIQRLADTLSSVEDAVLVYPMVEVFGQTGWFIRAGGDHVLNTFVWRSQDLHTGNIVHAPYLMRAERLRALGGFTVDPALDAFEDYDLMCRVAEASWRGQLVPQVLARRLERPGTSSLTTIRPRQGPATWALVARAPRAMVDAFSL